MSLSDDLANVEPASQARRDIPDPAPKGWEPGVTFDGSAGTITSPPTDGEPDWDALLGDYLPPGWDATQFTIDPDSVKFASWDMGYKDKHGEGVAKRLYSFRARILRRTSDSIDVEALTKWVRSARPHRAQNRHGDALVVCWADWQVGKAGTDQTTERFVDSIGKVQDLIRDHKPSVLHVLGLGDLGEGCSGHYAMQTFEVELNERDQRKLCRTFIVKALKAWAPTIDEIVVSPVGGNHGEVRQDGKAFTSFSDNRDVAVFEDAALILNENPDAFGHIRFTIPEADLTQSLRIGPLIVGIAHGHQARKGTQDRKILDWWRGQMAGRQPVGDADLLVTGHYHHLRVVQDGGRTWMQAPALDSGSEWWANIAGVESPPGTLTFTVGANGWDHLRVV